MLTKTISKLQNHARRKMFSQPDLRGCWKWHLNHELANLINYDSNQGSFVLHSKQLQIVISNVTRVNTLWSAWS